MKPFKNTAVINQTDQYINIYRLMEEGLSKEGPFFVSYSEISA